MKKVNRKLPQSVKNQRKIDAALAAQETVHKRHIDALQRKYGDSVAQLQNKLDVSQQPVIVSNAGQYDPQQLLKAMQRNPDAVLPVASATRTGPIVSNWQSGWKWFSNIAFALIVAVQAFYDTLPPELIATLPADTQSTITATLAILGLLGRFINQNKPKPLPAVENHDV
ncbi:hypothetical protein [Acinetobacter puyangensis]|uniref:DUF7940 domain-containing protein n=1 Tax=Acinetobacter puyangensis TaxID=1096779 RepID=UPI003A4DCCCA